ncbi:hypothetical protein J6590_061864 [Homalodisca vitripennis]|nr:hypothetical protein J6590_061864 [Homalodisca vitripennis]
MIYSQTCRLVRRFLEPSQQKGTHQTAIPRTADGILTNRPTFVPVFAVRKDLAIDSRGGKGCDWVSRVTRPMMSSDRGQTRGQELLLWDSPRPNRDHPLHLGLQQLSVSHPLSTLQQCDNALISHVLGWTDTLQSMPDAGPPGAGNKLFIRGKQS